MDTDSSDSNLKVRSRAVAHFIGHNLRNKWEIFSSQNLLRGAEGHGELENDEGKKKAISGPIFEVQFEKPCLDSVMKKWPEAQ